MTSIVDTIRSAYIRRPHRSFYKLNSHRLPTLGLYKDLLKICPERQSIRDAFRRWKNLTSPRLTIAKLTEGYESLEALRKGDVPKKLQRINEQISPARKEEEQVVPDADERVTKPRRLRTKLVGTNEHILMWLIYSPIPRKDIHFIDLMDHNPFLFRCNYTVVKYENNDEWID